MKKSILHFCVALFLVALATGGDAPLALAQDDLEIGAGVGTPVSPDINPSTRHSSYIPIQTNPTDMKLVAVGTVKEVIKSTLIKLEDGKVFSLINMRIPLLYDDRALEHLRQNYIGKKVGVYQRDYPGVGIQDTRGNLTGHIVTDENVWMQADLVLHGLAWPEGTAKNRDLVQKLYQFEAQARSNKSGFWASPSFAMKNARQLDDQMGTFQVVEDVIKNVSGKGQTYYINFGDNPAKDFTVTMANEVAFYFRKPNGLPQDPRNWDGQRVRVRGWVKPGSGPLMEMTHPEQLEFLSVSQRKTPK